MKKFFVLFALGAFLTTPAFAQKKEVKPAKVKVKLTLKEKKIVKSTEAAMAEKEIKSMNEVCGSKIKVSIDWASFKKADAISNSVKSGCTEALDRIKSTCKDELGKEAVSSTIKAVSCVYAEKKDISHSMKKGTLIEAYWAKVGGNSYQTQGSPRLDTWLGDNL